MPVAAVNVTRSTRAKLAKRGFMADINATVAGRFEAGGIFTITPQGGTALIVLNIVPNSFKVKPPMIKPIPYTDRQAQQDPLEGEVMPGEMRVGLRASKYAGAELFTVLTARKGTPDGKVPLHTIEVKIPAHKSAVAGEKFTTTKAYLLEQPQPQAGEEFDTYELVFGINDLVAATY